MLKNTTMTTTTYIYETETVICRSKYCSSENILIEANIIFTFQTEFSFNLNYIEQFVSHFFSNTASNGCCSSLLRPFWRSVALWYICTYFVCQVWRTFGGKKSRKKFFISFSFSTNWIHTHTHTHTPARPPHTNTI